jgi:hypothetical protein
MGFSLVDKIGIEFAQKAIKTSFLGGRIVLSASGCPKSAVLIVCGHGD